MRRRVLRVFCVIAATVVASAGALVHGALTEMAGAVPPPVITTDYALYPPSGSIPASCPTTGTGVVQGLRFYLIPGPASPARPAQWTSDPGGAGDYATTRSSRRFETFPDPSVLPGDTVVALWNGWTPGCENVGVSMSVKKTENPTFDITDDQALVREPNGSYQFAWCQSSTDPCSAAGVNRLEVLIPPATVSCNFQLDLAIGAPLETVGPRGSYYTVSARQQAEAAGLGTFNTTGPTMLLDAVNQGFGNCAQQPRIVIDKQWVGTGAQPPTNVPAEFLLTVTSFASASDSTVLATATCNVAGGVFTCDYRDQTDPTVPQSGLLVNATSVLTVTETGFPGNTVDVTFPVSASSRFVTCPSNGGPCLFTITNTPPPPPVTTTTQVSAPTTTEPPTAPTTGPSTEPTALPVTIPATLPATGSSDPVTLPLLGALLVPFGAALIVISRRRARTGS